jgi:O-acetyl-ADP-ribose deacetylase (regulator of RNase III)
MKFRKKHNSSASGVTPVIKSQAGDIVKIGTDAIVNAANSNLAAGGGVCGAIFSAAGHKQLQTACTKIGRCEVGSAVVTPAFGLESVGTRHILHAVGPIWGKSSPEECDRLLVSAYRSSLMLAQSLGASSIAIPALSS